MYRLWLNGLYGLYGPRCPLSSKRPINLISLSLTLSHVLVLIKQTIVSRPWFIIKMSCYQCRKSHCGDKKVVRSSYLHNGISYTGMMTSLYWISPPETHFRNKLWVHDKNLKIYIYCSYVNTNDLNKSKFCTCHNRSTVVTCAKFGID